ncbi:MAG: DNA modification methylase [Clostridia bacterium]|jgi:DNA modification methylase
MDIKMLNINEIKPYDKNPRKNDKAVDKVASSIKEFGFQQPIVVDKEGVIIVGHTRYKAAKKLKISEIPVLFANNLSDEQAKAYRLADNKTNEFAEWDLDLLAGELGELKAFEFDMQPYGFEDIKVEVEEDDFDVDAAIPDEPITKRNDIWLLGKHKLICGDSTSDEDISKLMDNHEADLVLTDPPYNVDYEGATKEKLKIQNDKMKDDTFHKFLTDSFFRMYDHSKKGAAIYCFHADSEGYNFRSAFKQAGYQLRQCLVWIKSSMVMGRQDYQWQHEPILYGWKDGASHTWYGDRKQTTLVKFEKPHRNGEHPTMKPIGLCGYFISNSSKEGDIILDPFGGSGSTMIAAEQIGRTCYMSELDEKYCDVIIKRYIELMGSDDNVFLLENGKKKPYKNLDKIPLKKA